MKRKGSLKINSVWHKWSAVKLQEIYWSLSIILHMCFAKLPKISDYWSTDPFPHTGFASKLVRRDRFCATLSMLHLNDNATFTSRGEEKHDPLHKVRPLFDFFVNKSKFSFRPGMNLTIDEASVPFVVEKSSEHTWKTNPTNME
ncbi:piggyBac transposable element-derived protein 4-like [Schistocerca serialis cubense]|uniref:piggyBac transposable element-derived protein 4-like n=1 Tax=Schistocerca serialis cubense TaxID=2023355 RepID=UPI00214E54AE|nr:piggyBac transposable element-derived protein 4-like [Schistocerca serialis cubense]